MGNKAILRFILSLYWERIYFFRNNRRLNQIFLLYETSSNSAWEDNTTIFIQPWNVTIFLRMFTFQTWQFPKALVSYTSVSSGPMKMRRFGGQTNNLCQTTVACFVHVAGKFSSFRLYFLRWPTKDTLQTKNENTQTRKENTDKKGTAQTKKKTRK